MTYTCLWWEEVEPKKWEFKTEQVDEAKVDEINKSYRSIDRAMAMSNLLSCYTSGRPIAFVRVVAVEVTPEQIKKVEATERDEYFVKKPVGFTYSTRDPSEAEIAACPIAQEKK